MEIIYEGKDITPFVTVRRCVFRDAAGDRCDSLDIEFENAIGWFRWGPAEDDRLRVTQDRIDTGSMFVNTVLPEDGRFRIYATALPLRARRREFRSFAGKNLNEIMQSVAASCGMGWRLFGIDGGTEIPYIEQEDESGAAFLSRLLRMEGAALKCVNGKLCAIGLLYAQERAAQQGMTVSADQTGPTYFRNGEKLRSLTVRSPYAEASATDGAVPSDHVAAVRSGIPARESVQAGRWARGLLLDHNRRCESLTIPSELNPGFSALTRIDVTGDADADGEWLIESVEHDFINRTSDVLMHRCVRTIR